MKNKIKRNPKNILMEQTRHRTGGIDDHRQGYYHNIGKKYADGNFRQNAEAISVKEGDYRKSKYLLTKEKLLEGLPQGSGIDADWYIEDMGSYFRADNSYHCMDEYGFYDGWQGFSLIIPKKNPDDFRFHFTGDQYLAKKYMLREYLDDTIAGSISEMTDSAVKSGHLGKKEKNIDEKLSELRDLREDYVTIAGENSPIIDRKTCLKRIYELGKEIDELERKKSGHYRIKGWEKDKESGHGIYKDDVFWKNDCTGRSVSVVESRFVRGAWDVVVPRYDGRLETIYHKIGKKEDAHDVAVDWMKAHPEG